MKNTSSFYQKVNLILVIIIVVFVNLIGVNLFFRVDVTHNDAYSLSEISRETLAGLADPLRIKVFYSDNVPAPYNSVRRYLFDILREYRQVDKNLSFEIINVEEEAGRLEAQQYGLRQVEIQEIRSDEFQSRAVFMGIVVLYGNASERVDQLTTAEGMEYRITIAVRSVISQVDTLSGTTEPVQFQVFASPSLSSLNITGFSSLKQDFEAIYQIINQENFGRIAFDFIEPENSEEIQELVDAYGLEKLQWSMEDGLVKSGILSAVISYKDDYEHIPIEIYSQLFGGYTLENTEKLEEEVRLALRSLVTDNPRIAYTQGGEEKNLQDYEAGAGPFASLLNQRYEVTELNLETEDIPADIDTVIINGPRSNYTDSALYRIDQFLMNGGSLMVFIDGHVSNITPQQAAAAGIQPSWEPNKLNLLSALKTYGVDVTHTIILDEESYVLRQGNQQVKIFQAPILSGSSINRDIVITAELEDIIIFNAVELLPQLNDKAESTILLQTSKDSWVVNNPSEIGPWIQGAPDEGNTAQRAVALLVEGDFTSFFDAPVDLQYDVSTDTETGEIADLRTGVHRKESFRPGKILVLSTAALTTAQLLEPNARTTNGTFLLNAVDYLNGAQGFAALRSKGLGVPRIEGDENASIRQLLRWINIILAPGIMIIWGIITWLRRKARSRWIREKFQEVVS